MLALMPAIPALLIYSRKTMSNTPGLYRLLWVTAFLFNIAAVRIPGRFDSLQKWEGGITWESFFEPSTWAFSIWALIFSTEFVASVFVGFVGEPKNALVKATPFWVAGNLFQALWCAAFRPPFKEMLWLPASLLVLTTISLGLGHLELTTSIRYLSSAFNSDSQWKLLLLRIPLALHVGWVIAASMVNLNAWLAMSKASEDTLAVAAYLSACGGAIGGAALAWHTRDPVIAFTIAWALAALSDRTRQKSTLIIARGASRNDFTGKFLGGLATTEKVLSYAMLALGPGIAVTRDIF